MDRRECLASVGSIGFALLAGCPGDGGGEDTPTATAADTPTATQTATPAETATSSETDTQTEEPTATPSELEQRIQDRVLEYGTLADEYASHAQNGSAFTDVSPSIRVNLLEDARDLHDNVDILDRAEPETDAEAEAIEQLFGVADCFEELILVHEYLSRANGAVEKAWEDAGTGSFSTRNSSVGSHVGDAQTHFDSLQAESSPSDFEVLSEVDLGPDDYESRVDAIETEIAAYEDLQERLRSADDAATRLAEARDHYINDRYQEASTSYYSAAGDFEDSVSDLDGEWPRSLEDRVSSMQCGLEGAVEVCEAMDEAAQAGDAGNTDRQALAETDAEEAYEGACDAIEAIGPFY